MFWIEVMPCRAHHSQPALHDGAIVRQLLRRRLRIGLAAGRQAEPRAALAGKLEQRPERLAFAQFAVRQPVGAHDDLVARPERLARAAGPPASSAFVFAHIV